MNNTFKRLLKRLSDDGCTYENWCQYQALARLTAANWNTELGRKYEALQIRFFELCNLTDFTQKQLLEGLELPELTWKSNYYWSSINNEWKYDDK